MVRVRIEAESLTIAARVHRTKVEVSERTSKGNPRVRGGGRKGRKGGRKGRKGGREKHPHYRSI